MRASRERLAQAWTRWGARQVHEEPLAGLSWHPAQPALLLDGVPLDCIDCLPVPPAEVCGPVVDLRHGQPVVPGAIGIMTGGQTEAGLIQNWSRQGLIGALVASEVLPDRPQLWYFYEDVPIPVIGIAGRDVARLVGREAVLQTAGRAKPATCANLVASLGPETADCLLLGAHLDSHHIAPGVFDNLSGVFGLCGVLQRLAPHQHRFRRQLRLIAYTGEEYSHQGSHAYLAEHRQDLAQCHLVVNFDSLCAATARGIAVIGCPQWIEPLRQRVPAPVEVRDFFCIGSDYLPFVLAGIPAVRPADFHDSLPPWTHYRDDTWAHHAPDDIAANVDLWSSLLLNLLTTEQLPLRRHRPAHAIMAEVASHGWTELLARKLHRSPAAQAIREHLQLPAS